MIDPHRALVHSLVAEGYVDMNEVLDGSVSFVELGRRNHGLRVLRSPPRASLVVKFATTRSDARVPREIAFYRHIARDPSFGELLRIIVRSIDQRSNDILCIELMPNASSVFESFQAHHGLSPDVFAALGKTVGTFHRHSAALMRAENGVFTAEHRMPWAFTLDTSFGAEYRRARRSDRRILDVIRSDSELPPLLRALVAEWKGDTVIHGDLKWDNCLLSSRTEQSPEIKIVDWESIQLGDPAWDLAGILHDFFHAWVWSMPTTGRSHARRIQAAHYTLERLRGDIGTFWDAYVAVAGPHDTGELLLRSLRFTGARLIEAILQHERYHASLTRHSVLLLELCRNLMRDPAAATHEFVGA